MSKHKHRNDRDTPSVAPVGVSIDGTLFGVIHLPDGRWAPIQATIKQGVVTSTKRVVGALDAQDYPHLAYQHAAGALIEAYEPSLAMEGKERKCAHPTPGTTPLGSARCIRMCDVCGARKAVSGSWHPAMEVSHA